MSASRTRLERWASERLDRASAEELAACALLQRQETKFLMPAAGLSSLIAELAPHYRAVRANTSMVATYRTLYYDTPKLRCFHGHRERLPHHKVRVRHYDERGLSVVEVKTKSKDLRSLKFRQTKKFGDSELGDQDREFVSQHLPFPADDLIPQVWTNFCRMTLVGATGERVTVDSELGFRRGEVDLRFPEIAVIEVKQERYTESTPIMQVLARMGLRPMQVSKYGAAVAMTDARHASTRFANGTRAPWPG